MLVGFHRYIMIYHPPIGRLLQLWPLTVCKWAYNYSIYIIDQLAIGVISFHL